MGVLFLFQVKVELYFNTGNFTYIFIAELYNILYANGSWKSTYMK